MKNVRFFDYIFYFFSFMLVSITEVCKYILAVHVNFKPSVGFSVQVLELPTGKVLATLLGHTKTVFWCQFSQDGQTLITSSEDTTIRVGSPLSSFLCLVLLPFFTLPIDFASPIPIPHVSKTI